MAYAPPKEEVIDSIRGDVPRRRSPSSGVDTGTVRDAAVVAASVSSGRSFSWPGWMRPKVRVPTVFFVLVAAYQIFELLSNYQVPLYMRSFVYFLVFVVSSYGLGMPQRQAASLSVISFFVPYVWERVPKTAELAAVNAILLVLAMCWALWLSLTAESISFVVRLAFIIFIFMGIIWPQVDILTKRFGVSDYTPNLDPRQTLLVAQKGVQRALKVAGDFPQAVVDSWRNLITEASGGVAARPTDDRPLGIFIDSAEAADPNPVAGKRVSVISRIRAETVSKPIPIVTKCWADRDTSDELAGVVLPAKVELYSGETRAFTCRFDKGFKPGHRSIMTAATFPFSTDAELDSYFLAEARLNSIREDAQSRSGDDSGIISSYKLPTETPITGYSPGPVYIAIDVPRPPVGISEGQNDLYIGVELKNRWKGRIDSINSMKLLLPRGLSIISSECSHRFMPARQQDDYNVYELDIGAEREGNPDAFTNIGKDKVQKLFCSVGVDDAPALLGDTGIAIRKFKVVAEYVYSVEKDVSVEVKAVKKLAGASQGGAAVGGARSGSGDGGSDGSGSARVVPPVGASDVQRVKFWANHYGVDMATALQVAALESGDSFSQFKDADARIPLVGDGGCSYGVMQINVCTGAHPKCDGTVVFNPSSGDMCLGAQSCSGTNVKDNADCNIEAGMRLLKAGYDASQSNPFADGCYCGRYSGWDYALKYYNGCVCGNSYVEYVRGKDIAAVLDDGTGVV